ncbi:hydroxymethylbilane synthase [Aestuariivirga sp.]|uniref:hydroxymethylbilane synthase n=1 Tax=Aestuariivirga sp. TaxID=2650926 RepID=UPI0039E4C5AE
MTKIRIGTRGSPLALAQAHETRERLVKAHGLSPDDFEITVITTTGDRIRDRPLAEIGGKGLFTKEIEEALFAKTIDLAVHSMKDMPAVLPRGLAFAATLPREDARDALISLTEKSLKCMKQGAVLGSSSVRRSAQALRIRPDLQVVQFRGNVETRLRKLADGVADASFLAVAGLRRLGLTQHIAAVIPMEEMLPAIAQGAIGIEIREGDEKIAKLLEPINHGESATAMACERAFLAALDGSCRTPIAGHARLADGRLHFRGETLTLDGKKVFTAERVGSPADAARMGADAAAEVKANGGSLIVGAS